MRKRVNKKKYSKLAKDVGFNDIKSMTGLSIREGNIEALMGMAKSNIYAVTAELQKSEYNQLFSQKFKIIDPEEVKRNVKANIEIFKQGGGYIFNNVHNIQAGVPPENIIAMYEAAYQYGFSD